MALQSWLEGLETESDGTTRPYDVTAPFGFQLHSAKTDKGFPNCCDDHQAAFQEIKNWAKDFLAEDDAISLAEKTVLNLAHTEHYLRYAFELNDWYDDISYNLEVNIFSFGSSIKYAERYLLGLIGVIKSIQNPSNFEKSEKISYLAFLWLKNSLFSRDLLNFRKAFDKWFYSFPFKLSFFQVLEDKYDLFFGIVNDDFADLDDSSFMAELNKLTDAILYHYNSSNLYKQGLLADPLSLKLELIASQRSYQLNNEIFYGQDSESDPEYKRMIKKWFEDERKYIDDIISMGTTNPSIIRPGSLDLSTAPIKSGKAEHLTKTKSGKPKNIGVHETNNRIDAGNYTLNQICIALYCMQLFKESPEAKIIIKNYYGSENPASLKNHNIVSHTQFTSLDKKLDKDKWKRAALQKVLRIVTSENHAIGIENATQYWREFWTAYTKYYKTKQTHSEGSSV